LLIDKDSDQWENRLREVTFKQISGVLGEIKASLPAEQQKLITPNVVGKGQWIIKRIIKSFVDSKQKQPAKIFQIVNGRDIQGIASCCREVLVYG
jgi:hypothetical protein